MPSDILNVGSGVVPNSEPFSQDAIARPVDALIGNHVVSLGPLMPTAEGESANVAQLIAKVDASKQVVTNADSTEAVFDTTPQAEQLASLSASDFATSSVAVGDVETDALSVELAGEPADEIMGLSSAGAAANSNNPRYQYDNNDYLLTSGLKTWREAQAEARSLGGNLVAINNAAEEAWLKRVFGADQGLWIGISDRQQEGSFTWANGDAVTYTNWAPGEPSDMQGNQDYGWMNFGATRQWDDNFADALMPGIIEIARTNPVTEESPATNPGFIAIGNNNLRVNEGAESVDFSVVRRRGAEGTVTVDYRTVAGTATIGEDYRQQTGTLTFAPEETQKTVSIPILDNDIVETEEQFAIAIDNVTGGATLLAPRTAQVTIVDNDAPTIAAFRNNTYFISETAKSWGEVQAEALRRGGNLVTINSAEEEDWLQQTFGTAEGFWIGLSDQNREGTFEWASGQPLVYENWAPGEPSDLEGDQDYGRMNFGSGSNKQWDDEKRSANFRGIIEMGGDNTPPNTVEAPPANTAKPTAETIVSGLNLPTAVDWMPERNRMLIAEKGGTVKVVQNNKLLAKPFIDISPQVNEIRGLLDIAVHPDFDNNPYVYLLYAYDPPDTFAFEGNAGPDGRGNRAGRLTRVTADAATNYRTAVPNSEVVLLGKNSTWENFNPFVDSTVDLDEPPAGILPDGSNLQDFLAADSESHTIGSVEFGLDGALYVSNGDGTSYNQVDPRTTRVQDIDNLSGKILRVDPLTGAGLADNPFYNGDSSANRSKVYQLGLRNPFRFAIDPVTGAPVIGDVGWTNWEEINTGGPGANFGWPYYEGANGVNRRTTEYKELPEAKAFYKKNPRVTPALLGLNHADDGIDAIVMGDIYDGDAYPDQYKGDIFYNHLGRGLVRNVSLDADGNVTDVEDFATDTSLVVHMKVGPDGTLHYVDLDDGEVGRWTFEQNA